MQSANKKSATSWILGSLAVCSLVLLGCGGGGGGGGAPAATTSSESNPALVADFSYPGNALLLHDTAMDIQVSGLAGSTLSCSVSAGSLPAGLSLTQGCRVVGFPTAPGTTTPTIRLTASGYSGFVDKRIPFQVFGPNLLYEFPPYAFRGAVISARPTDGDPNPVWTQGPDVTAFYQVLARGELPAGLVLDSSTGEVHGILTTTQHAVFPIGVSLSSSHGGAFIESPVVWSIDVLAPGLSFFYAPNDSPLSVTAGTPMDLAPLYVFGSGLDPSAYTFGTYRLAVDSPPLPAGLALDPITGHLSGTPTVAGTYHPVLEVILNSQGQSAPYRSSVLDLTINP